MSSISRVWVRIITQTIKRIVGGDVTHLTMAPSDLCREKGIELMALYPNATHILFSLKMWPSFILWKVKEEEWERIGRKCGNNILPHYRRLGSRICNKFPKNHLNQKCNFNQHFQTEEKTNEYEQHVKLIEHYLTNSFFKNLNKAWKNNGQGI